MDELRKPQSQLTIAESWSLPCSVCGLPLQPCQTDELSHISTSTRLGLSNKYEPIRLMYLPRTDTYLHLSAFLPTMCDGRCNKASSQHLERPLSGSELKLQSSFSKALNSTVEGYSLAYFGHFMQYIPSRLGRNPALDTAAECILSAFSANFMADSYLWRLVQHQYIKALKTLGSIITTPGMSTSAETLCATMLLLHYEITVKRVRKEATTWLTHSRGATKIMAARGPDLCRDGFGAALYFAQYGGTWAESLIDGNHCFLLGSEWQRLSASIEPNFWPNHCPELPADEACQVFQTVWHQTGYIANILIDIRRYMSGSMDFKSLLSTSKLAEHIYNQDFSDWISRTLRYATITLPTRNEADWEVNPLSYDWEHFYAAAICYRYWATRILLIGSLRRLYILGAPTCPSINKSTLGEEMTSLSNHLCMSFDYASKLFPFGFRLIPFPLQMAAAGIIWQEDGSVVNREERMTFLTRKAKDFAVIAPDAMHVTAIQLLQVVVEVYIPPLPADWQDPAEIMETLVLRSMAYA